MTIPTPYTNIKVKLIGEDGNAFHILAKVTKALREAGYDQTFIDEYVKEVTFHDYDHLLTTTMVYVEVE